MEIIFKCGVCHKSDFISKQAFFHHLQKYPETTKDKYLCMQDNCFVELRNLATFRKHISNHIQRGKLTIYFEIVGVNNYF